MKTTLALIAVCLFAAFFFLGVAVQAFAVPTAGGLACAVFAGGLFFITMLASFFMALSAWLERRKPF